MTAMVSDTAPLSTHVSLLAILVLSVALSLVTPGTGATAGSAPSPPSESKSRVALLHMVNDVWFFRDLAAITLRNKQRYAARHGYELVVHESVHGGETSGLWSPSDCNAAGAVRRGEGNGAACFVQDNRFQLDNRAPTFGKLKLAMAACKGRHDYWLLWTDADALIFNQARSLLDIVDDAYDIMIASDWFMINAGVLLLRCSPWTTEFLQKVYDAREFDKANALDQSALGSFFEHDDVKPHVKHVPKWLINVYTEEAIPGDFILHFAGKLYEATPKGITAIARQFDTLSRVDDIEKVKSFFNTRYFLGYYSGTCVMGKPEVDPNRDCFPNDERRLKLDAPLGAFSTPNRYRQLEFRNPRHANWKDVNDVPGRADPQVRRVVSLSP